MRPFPYLLVETSSASFNVMDDEYEKIYKAMVQGDPVVLVLKLTVQENLVIKTSVITNFYRVTEDGARINVEDQESYDEFIKSCSTIPTWKDGL